VVHGGRNAIDAYRGLLARKATHERNPG